MEKLFSVARSANLVNFPETKVLSIFYDDPDKVAAAELRSDACITAPESTEAPDEMHRVNIPGGRFAVAHVELDPSEYGAAWKKLQADWIPSQGLQIDSESGRLCYEVYLNNPAEHPEQKHVVNICEPIV